MKLSLLPYLASPCCQAPLRFAELAALPDAHADIVSGQLGCTRCDETYPIKDGVPRLLLGGEGDARVAKTRASFTWEWMRYPGSLAEDERVFLEECQLPAAEFAGKLVLDAGCGMGRYALVARALGAEVVAVDLSDSLLRLVEAARRDPKLHVVQGDLLRPPLCKDAFDIVYSHGVLHHTRDTRAAFQAVAGLAKKTGLLSVWLYGQAGRFADFATNPLRPDRAWVMRHRRLAWSIVAVRHGFSDFLRFFTTRLPLAATYAVCYPLTLLGMVPLLKYLTFSVHPDFRVRLIENFDWLSPPFQYHHTKEELADWYAEAGYEVLRVLPHGLVPKPGILGRKRRG
ncbi:MAG: methyltransferase domain-containing protein [Elusimicrobiota bacterium]|jgi:SAM-dependent methyltransferase